jgi:surface polysaccharide O-acyltransferase-like enzyme
MLRATVRQRFAEIDVLKAAGIAAVVLIHSLRPWWDPGVAFAEIWLGHVTRFGVPAFLFASGFLYATRQPIAWETTRRRLRRILVPYLVASLLVEAWRALAGAGAAPLTLLGDLALGRALGPYYYVFDITGLVLFAPLLARLPARALGGVVLAFLAAQAATDVGLFTYRTLALHLRNPLVWWAYFLVGWWVRLNLASWERFVGAHRGRLLLLLLPLMAIFAAVSGLEGRGPQVIVRGAAWLNVYAILAILYASALGREASPRAVRLASDASYPVYLYHLPIVLAVQRLVPAPAGELAPLPLLLAWAAGLAGTLLAVTAARRLLGARSRDWIGA